jgi:FMN phosphatase YigB (HAD superfamily)
MMASTTRPPVKKLRVFDFDDTLVRTNSFVRLRKPGGEQVSMTPAEYAVYSPMPDDDLDFEDFKRLNDPREISWTLNILRSVVRSGGDAIILTARGSEAKPHIEEFLAKVGVPGIEVVTLGDSNPMMKAAHIAARIEEFGYNFVEFFDDSVKNVHAVERMVANRYPDVTVRARHVVHKSDAHHRVTESRLRQIIRNSLL